MRTFGATVFLMAGLLMAADKPKQDTVKEEIRKLQGTWVVVSFHVAGQPLDAAKGRKWTFSGDKLKTPLLKGEMLEQTYQLDPAKKPKAIDFYVSKDQGGPGFPTKCIYELEGDTLKIAMPGYEKARKGERPKELSEGEADLVVLRREKP